VNSGQANDSAKLRREAASEKRQQAGKRLPLEPSGLAREDAQEEQGQLEGEDSQEEQGQLDQLLVVFTIVEALDGHVLLDHVERDVFEPHVPCGVVRFLQTPKPRASGETATMEMYNSSFLGS
jgi:hypothetical protein